MTKKTTYTILIVAILAVVVMYFYNKYNVAPSIDLAQLTVVDQNNTKFNIVSLKGKKVILSFYASWCPPCREELKILSKIKEQKLADYEILAVTDENLEKLIEFKNKTQYLFTFLALTKVFSDIGINSIPTTYLLNAKGEIVYNNVGYIDWENESTFQHLTSLMQ